MLDCGGFNFEERVAHSINRRRRDRALLVKRECTGSHPFRSSSSTEQQLRFQKDKEKIVGVGLVVCT